MTLRCGPGRRLLAESGHAVQPCTMGGIVAEGERLWGLTAGHALNGFGDGQRVWYFPEAQRALLGAYKAPAVVEPHMDLAKFQVPNDLIAFEPVGFARPPLLFPEDKLDSLVGQAVVFLGGQVGRISGRIAQIASVDSHSRAILVRLACTALIIGDSGGPLYHEDGNDLFWVGTLVSGQTLANQAGFSEGLFLHPGRALAKLGIV